ncbi:MAG: phosphoglycolate phosphatase [Verrucomicrobiales bacterium]|nr:phosphoglycolate phosphatase [Verrucomicrobiales bacterium]
MILGGKIEAVTFDVGGTLIEPFPSVGHVYSQVAARHGVHVAPEVLNTRFAAAWKSRKNFGHSISDWSGLVDATFAGLVDPMPSQTFFHELFTEFTKPTAWRIFDDVIPCLERLQDRKVRLAVISNWDERLRPLLHALNLARFFEATIVSIELGAPKPDPQIFVTAAQQLHLEPSQILHIGDSLNEDVNCARAAGFAAMLIAREKPPAENEQLSSLLQLCG